MEIGTAGEHIVCADLLLIGHRASMASAGLPYDVIADVDGELLRIAVKSTLAPVPRPGREGSKARYHFHTTRPALRSSGSRTRHPYTWEHIDLFAFVALDIRAVAYLVVGEQKSYFWLEADTPQATSKYAGGGLIRGIPDLTLSAALERRNNG